MIALELTPDRLALVVICGLLFVLALLDIGLISIVRDIYRSRRP